MQINYLELLNLRSFIDASCTTFLTKKNTESGKNHIVALSRAAVHSNMGDICKITVYTYKTIALASLSPTCQLANLRA